MEESEPTFDFIFNERETFPLYSALKNGTNSGYVKGIYDQIFDKCKGKETLLLKYLEHFPTRSVNIDMSEANQNLEESSKIFLLSA